MFGKELLHCKPCSKSLSLRHIHLSTNLYQRQINDGYGPWSFSIVSICLRSETREVLCASPSHWAEDLKTPAGDDYLFNEYHYIKTEEATLSS